MSEIFPNTCQNISGGISGHRNISDDLIAVGTTESECDQTLRKVLQVAKDHNL